jgi:hypothetical protein
MLEADILEQRSSHLPVIGNVSMKGVTKVLLGDLTAELAYRVTEGSGPAKKIVGKAYAIGDAVYFVKQLPVHTPEEDAGTVHLVTQAQLINEKWDGSGHTRDVESIKGKFRPIPDEDRPNVIPALEAAVATEYSLARPSGPKHKKQLHYLIG